MVRNFFNENRRAAIIPSSNGNCNSTRDARERFGVKDLRLLHYTQLPPANYVMICRNMMGDSPLRTLRNPIGKRNTAKKNIRILYEGNLQHRLKKKILCRQNIV